MPLDQTAGPMSAALSPSALPGTTATPTTPATTPNSVPNAAPLPSQPATGGRTPDVDFEALGSALNGALANMQNANATEQSLQPPELTPMPTYQAPAPSNPIHAWGSTAMALAAIGSLLTRHPLTTALNAGSQVLQAYTAGDQARAKQAFDQWKTATGNALKMQDFELRNYTAAIAKAGDDTKAAEGELIALASAYKDDAMNQVLQNYGVQGAVSLVASRGKAAASLANSSGNLQTYQNEQTAWQQYLSANPNATPSQKAKAMKQVFGQSIADSGVSPDDLPGPGGLSKNQWLALAKNVQGGGKAPVFDPGKAGDAERDAYNQAMAQVIADPMSGGGGSGTASGQLSVQTVNALGVMVAKGAPINNVLSGMGNKSAEMKAEVLNAAVNYDIAHGIDPSTIMTAQGDYSANKSALTAMTKMANSAAGFEQTVMSNMKLTKSLQAAAKVSDVSPLLNQIAQYGEVQTGSPAVLAFGAALTSTMTEYAKVMAGGTGSVAASSDSAREEALGLVKRFSTGAQLDAVFAVMQQEMTNRMNGYANSIDAINQAIARGASATGDTGDDSGDTQGGGASGGDSNIPSDAINYLKQNPNLAAQFDEKYGPGSAEKILGQ